ncbi:MAG: GNAT family acetyltransferase [Deltaproteobacteria bacterium]|nr:MAG: GNAT family acetyltransferase [Deltaproteobacteria bacterium]
MRSKTNETRIRPFKPEDQEKVVGLWAECGLVVPQNNPERDIQRKLGVNSELFLVGILGNEVVGTCMAGYEGHRGWINYLAVHPDYRRLGIATIMMKAAEDKLRKMGCPKINVQIRISNQEVIKFYESIGFSDDQVVSMGKRLEDDAAHDIG